MKSKILLYIDNSSEENGPHIEVIEQESFSSQLTHLRSWSEGEGFKLSDDDILRVELSDWEIERYFKEDHEFSRNFFNVPFVRLMEMYGEWKLEWNFGGEEPEWYYYFEVETSEIVDDEPWIERFFKEME